MRPNKKNFQRSALRPAQQGVVLVVALIVLVLMTIAGLAMMRQMGSGLSIAGNLAFKQSATSDADLGTEQARLDIKIIAPDTMQISDQPAYGYFSSWHPEFDPLTYDWSDNAKSKAAGSNVRYVIHRLCQSSGLLITDGAQRCATLEVNEGNPKNGPSGSGTLPPDPKLTPFYRITTRVTGARNAVSYIQVIAAGI